LAGLLCLLTLPVCWPGVGCLLLLRGPPGKLRLAGLAVNSYNEASSVAASAKGMTGYCHSSELARLNVLPRQVSPQIKKYLPEVADNQLLCKIAMRVYEAFNPTIDFKTEGMILRLSSSGRD